MTYDETTIDEEHREVRIHQPDGKPDVLQQIEHGALSIVGGYRSMGRLYRGIIEPTLRQYVMLGDSDEPHRQPVFDPKAPRRPPPSVGRPGSPDDRWVFTEENPRRELLVAAGLAAGARALRGFNDAARRRVPGHRRAASGTSRRRRTRSQRVGAAVELLQATGDRRYADFLTGETDRMCANIAPGAGSDDSSAEHRPGSPRGRSR